MLDSLFNIVLVLLFQLELNLLYDSSIFRISLSRRRHWARGRII